MKTPVELFSDRVENYVKYRPSYPEKVLDALRAACDLHGSSVIADIGAGTGIFTGLLLGLGCQVFAVEPNDEMRRAAQQRHAENPLFQSVAGAAEQTGLAAESVDLITVAQAFHWFRTVETRQEFQRILRPHGWVALIWNQRKTDEPFQKAYDSLLHKHAPDYNVSNHRNVDDDMIKDFLGREAYNDFVFGNRHWLDLDGVKGRLQSASYTPTPDLPGFDPLMAELEVIFGDHAINGQVAFDYETKLYIGNCRTG